MTLPRFAALLTVLNLAILAWPLAAPVPVSADGDAGIIRARGLQIVDDQGRIRASLGVLPDSGAGETVLLRLINADGQPSVKIGASPISAAISLVGGDDQSYVLVEANGPHSTVKLVGPGGAAKTIAP
jgi:hypothetical protein